MAVKRPQAAPETSLPTGQRERQTAIAEAVIRQGTIGVEQLARLTGVSTMTVYRDLTTLEERGVLQRHHGKVVAVASSLNEADATFRLDQSAPEKEMIARAAAQLVEQGASFMLDDSTSGLWLLRAMGDLTPYTVVTNSLLVANEVASQPSSSLILSGGQYQSWAQAFLGPQAVEVISSMHADFCFLSASGISGMSCYHPYRDNAEVKKAMLGSCEKSVLLLDHSKFSRRALFSFARLDDFDHVVVDAAVPEDLRSTLRSAGVNLLVADEPATVEP